MRDTLEAALWRCEAIAVEPEPAPPPPPPTPAAAAAEEGAASAAAVVAASLDRPTTPDPVPPYRPASHPPGTLRLVAGAASVPHPSKAERGGEDAHFVSAAGLGAAGVADGVGGWAAEGVDPAFFSRALMAGAAAALEAVAAEGGEPCVRAALAAGHAATEGVLGSSTAVVAAATASPPGVAVAVLGDSGFRLLRGGRVALASDAQQVRAKRERERRARVFFFFFSSSLTPPPSLPSPLQHSFNTPYQLGAPGTVGGDDPAAADVYSVDAEAGDVVVLATDGVLDNLWPHEIEALVAATAPPAGTAGRTADAAADVAAALVGAAAANGADETYRSPWVVEAAAAGVLPFWMALRPRGGKLDDCTAVVAFVEEA
jgi:protein phosphatase PTC7